MKHHETMGETLGEWKVNGRKRHRFARLFLKLIQVMTYPQLLCCFFGTLRWLLRGMRSPFPEVLLVLLKSKSTNQIPVVWKFPQLLQVVRCRESVASAPTEPHDQITICGVPCWSLFPSHKTEQPKMWLDLHICSVSNGWCSRDCSWSSWSSFWIHGFIWK